MFPFVSSGVDCSQFDIVSVESSDSKIGLEQAAHDESTLVVSNEVGVNDDEGLVKSEQLVVEPVCQADVESNQQLTSEQLEKEERKMRKRILKKYCKSHHDNLENYQQKLPIDHIYRGKIRRINQPVSYH